MDFRIYRGRDWFEELKHNVSEYKNKDNAVESAKFGYDRDIKIPQWILGISITLLIFSRDIIDKVAPLWRGIAIALYIWIFILIIVGIVLVIIMSQRHRIGMMYVYRKKDEQDRKIRSKG